MSDIGQCVILIFYNIKPGGKQYHIITLMGLREAGERHHDLQWRLMCLRRLRGTGRGPRRGMGIRNISTWTRLDETNSDRPNYFWCTFHSRLHDFKRECLKYKAQITCNEKGGSINRPTLQLYHDDVLPRIRKYEAEHSDAVDWKRVVNMKSLPWPCIWETRLLISDIIYCKPDDFMKFKHCITNIIEFESETSPDSTANKAERFNISSKRMIDDGAQSMADLPWIIFFYDEQTNVSIEDVKKAIRAVKIEFLDEVVVNYYDEDGEWFRKYFKNK